jgi:hypothetical protein
VALLATLRVYLVRLGTHREASSGCYTAMALYPLTAAAGLAQRRRSGCSAMNTGFARGGKAPLPARRRYA